MDLPEHLIEFLRGPQHAVVGWTLPDGRPRSVATWYDWDDGAILLNMSATRRRARWIDEGVPISLTVLDAANWYRHLSLYGSVARLRDDTDRVEIDRMARRYTGRAYANREDPRVSVWMNIESWHGWDDGKPWG
jgi:PPOX class probable F420-dependent enzyme